MACVCHVMSCDAFDVVECFSALSCHRQYPTLVLCRGGPEEQGHR